MFCSNCGKEINDNAVMCVTCGCATKNSQSAQNTPPKSMLVALLLWFFLGGIGAHRFYLGYAPSGAVFLFLSIIGWSTLIIAIGIVPLLFVAIWWFIDLFLIVTNSLKPTDGSNLV